MNQVLLLNKSYEPISIISWQKAMCMLYLGKAEVVEASERVIRSPGKSHTVPSVIRLLNSFRRRPLFVKFSKANLFARDSYRCQYCGEKFRFEDLTYDHVLPKSRGGITSWENIVSCCSDCNTKKRDNTPEEIGLKLLSKPKRPNWIPVFSAFLAQRREVPDEWKTFCYGFEKKTRQS